ncbi:DUF5681 domain-containing protein [Aestuariivita boseongensis]|uniref:DUF5681 domain-containing protein n=1 Tax=Aestuariivita boseongensis TaxID=1470562 RepID=UPI000680FBBE|nr:DUF5681 domain-containing protein [Aestuariivita boseongensis]
MTDDKKPEDVVGYGKPPKSSQFKKGQSGNPKGRPKGSLDVRTQTREMLGKQVTITEGGKRKRVSALQATLMRLVEKSLKGDMRAIEKVLALATDMAAELEAQRQERSMSATDTDIFERFKQDILAGRQPPQPKGDADDE